MITKDIGNMGEDVAVKRLKKLRYKIIERNFSCRFGEIDIIASKGGYTVFVEVRYRKDEGHGSGAETVDIYKQRKLIRTAKLYLQKKNLLDFPARFDVVSISGDLQKDCKIEVIENAFECK